MTKFQEVRSLIGRIPLFWKVLVLVLVVAGIPLSIAVSTSLTAAITTAERLVSTQILQLGDRVSERLEYTLVSMEGDLEVLREIPRDDESVLAFTLGQRRELYGGEGESRKRFSAPKYLEVGWYAPTGELQSVVYKDAVVSERKAEKWLSETWCEDDSFVKKAIEAKGSVVVSGMTGCPLSKRSYEPGDGALGKRFDGGFRIAQAVLAEDGTVEAVASLVLAELHLTWALMSLERIPSEVKIWGMVVARDGAVLSHPDPTRIVSNELGPSGGVEGWNQNGELSLVDLKSGSTDWKGILQSVNGGESRVDRAATEGSAEWMIAVQPIAAEIGGYSGDQPLASVWVYYPRGEVVAEWLRLAKQYAILLVITAILALIGSVVLARNLTLPIRKLSIAAGAIAKGENPELQALDRGDEMGELSRAFVQMQQDLAAHQEALLRSERLAAVGTFVAGIVHETKNVLAGLGNYLTFLERRFKDDPVRDQVIGPMRRALDQLDMLTVRMRELALTPRFSNMELTEVLRHALELVEHQAREEQIEVQCDFEGAIHLQKADGSLLGQVFLNLILNAVQASPKGGHISLTATCEESKALVTVRDQGKGFDEDKLDEVFKPFMTTKAGGTGLGLYISRSIILRHGGDLRVENHPEGGALVTVELVDAAQTKSSTL